MKKEKNSIDLTGKAVYCIYCKAELHGTNEIKNGYHNSCQEEVTIYNKKYPVLEAINTYLNLINVKKLPLCKLSRLSRTC